MASCSLDNFYWSFEDVDRLIEVHRQLNAGRQGRTALGHITKSALVMMCASWEVYFEDLIVESVNYIIENINSPHDLPEHIQKNIIKFISKERHELATFKLAGEGWKETYIKSAEIDTSKLNTPKSEQLGVLSKNYLGIENISSNWTIGADGINEIMTRRGEIAHRGRDAEYTTFASLLEYRNRINLTVIETDNFLARYLKDLVNSSSQPWRRMSIPQHLDYIEH